VDADIPMDLQHKYAAFKYMADVCDAGEVSVKEMILLCVMTGHLPAKFRNGDVSAPTPVEVQPEPEPEPKPEIPREIDFENGDPVTTIWKGKERKGEFKGFDPNEQDLCHVKIEGDKLNYQKVLVADTKPRAKD